MYRQTLKKSLRPLLQEGDALTSVPAFIRKTSGFHTTTANPSSLFWSSSSIGASDTARQALTGAGAATAATHAHASPGVSLRSFAAGAKTDKQSKPRPETQLVVDEEDDGGRRYAVTDKIPQKPVTVVEATGYSIVILAGWGFLGICLYFLFVGTMTPTPQPRRPGQQGGYGYAASGVQPPNFGSGGPSGWGRN